MPYARQPGKRNVLGSKVPKAKLTDDPGFGGEVPVPVLEVEKAEPRGVPDSGSISPIDPDIIALGPPPDDASGIQKWNYRMLSIMAYKAATNPNLTDEQRMRRAAQLTAAAARHYPEAAKFDLAQQIAADNEAIASKKRARAAAKLERCPPAIPAKVIPIRAQGS